MTRYDPQRYWSQAAEDLRRTARTMEQQNAGPAAAPRVTQAIDFTREAAKLLEEQAGAGAEPARTERYGR